MGKIEEAGFLEGGDFFPCGTDLAMLGIGLRSNMEACQQLMDKDLLGTARFAVVRDDFDRNQVWSGVEGEMVPPSLLLLSQLLSIPPPRSGPHAPGLRVQHHQ